MSCLILLYIKTMETLETYWVSCKKSTTYKNYLVKRTKQNRLMLASNCSVSGKKKLRFIKYQEAIRL